MKSNNVSHEPQEAESCVVNLLLKFMFEKIGSKKPDGTQKKKEITTSELKSAEELLEHYNTLLQE